MYNDQPMLAASISISVKNILLSMNSELSYRDFDLLNNYQIEEFIKKSARARTRETFRNELFLPLQYSMSEEPNIDNFDNSLDIILMGCKEFIDRIDVLFNPTKPNICPECDDKQNGLLYIFFKLIKHALKDNTCVSAIWHQQKQAVKNNIQYDPTLNGPEKFDKFVQILRDELKIIRKSHDATQSLYHHMGWNRNNTIPTESDIKDSDQEYNDETPTPDNV